MAKRRQSINGVTNSTATVRKIGSDPGFSGASTSSEITVTFSRHPSSTNVPVFLVSYPKTTERYIENISLCSFCRLIPVFFDPWVRSQIALVAASESNLASVAIYISSKLVLDD